MKLSVFLSCLIALSVGGCSWIPRAGPSTSDVLEQGQRAGEILFDVVEVDDRVLSTLRAQPKESFAARFKNDTSPPEVRIAIGDTVSALIWESAAGGLFSEAPPAPPSARSRVEPLERESRPPAEAPPGEFGAPPQSPDTSRREQPRSAGNPPGASFSFEAA